MKKNILLLLLISGSVFADNIVNKSSVDNFIQFKQLVEQHNTKNMCVVYDMDNTILTNDPNFGGDHWAVWNSSLESSDARKVQNWTNISDFHSTEGALRLLMNYQVTESDTLPTVNYIKDELKIHSIVMTARTFDQYSAATNNQLKINGFDFTTNSIGETVKKYSKLTLIPNDTKTGYIAYYNGVYYSAENNKGSEIIKLVQEQRKITKNKNLCRNIIFIDNSQKNVNNVYQAFIKKNAIKSNLLSVHYTYDNRLDYLENVPNKNWDINTHGSSASLLKSFVNVVNKNAD